MIINGTGLLMQTPIKDMYAHKIKEHGVHEVVEDMIEAHLAKEQVT